jgi:hypothetical protein
VELLAGLPGKPTPFLNAQTGPRNVWEFGGEASKEPWTGWASVGGGGVEEGRRRAGGEREREGGGGREQGRGANPYPQETFPRKRRFLSMRPCVVSNRLSRRAVTVNRSADTARPFSHSLCTASSICLRLQHNYL